MNRRGFIGSILAFGTAPAIVRADALMRIVPRDMALAHLEGQHVEIIAPMTAEEVERRMREMMLDAAERICNPPLLDTFDLDAIVAQYAVAFKVPARMLRKP